MLAAVLREAGVKVGVYTSPHLLELNERIVVDGRAIHDSDVLELTRRLIPLVEEVADETSGHPTFFEVITSMAFEYLRKAGVDVAIVEVGLGGRLDSTNILTPVCSCITTVGDDHTHVLGSDPADVGREKGGIIKPGVPVVTGVDDGAALDVIREICEERGAPMHEVAFGNLEIGEGTFSFRGPVHEFTDIRVPLEGGHQVRNAATAMTLLDVVDPAALGLDSVAFSDGLPGWARSGMGKVRWPARMQVVIPEPLLMVDGSHNAAGLSTLAEELSTRHGEKAFDVIVGVMEDKDWVPMVRELLPLGRRFAAVTVDVERTLGGEELGRKLGELAGGDAVQVMSVEEALDRALAGPGPTVVTGSIYLAGEVLGVLRNRGAADPEKLGLPRAADPLY
jgi:dihydrofolate synthase/folylpolyglutamate synthase